MDGVTLVTKHDQPIRRCRSCGVAYAPHEPPAGALEQLYAEQYFAGAEGHYRDYVGDEVTHRRQARRYLRRLRRAGLGGGRLLDVGCAAGFFLDEARASGWTVQGVEVSPWAAAEARRRFGIDVLQGDFLTAPLEGTRFDVVTFFNVFEHLPHPRRVSERLADLLRPGGSVLVETWDSESLAARVLGAAWHQWDPRYVPYYYSRRSLRLIFDAARWRLRSWSRAAKWVSVERGCGIVGGSLPAGALRRAVDSIGRGPLGRLDVPYFTGDLVMAHLERR